MADETTSYPRGISDGSKPETKGSEFEGDYRPAAETYLDPVNARIEAADYSFLLRLTSTLNTTLDLRTLLKRTSELVAEEIPYRIFAILLLDDNTRELRMRYQIGHTPEVERMTFALGHGVVGPAFLEEA